MSRTDVHAPYWTWAEYYRPMHNHYERSCDLPPEPVRCNTKLRPDYPNDGWQSCYWRPALPDSWREYRWLHLGKAVPKWYVDHVWHNAERVRERDELRNLAREYNAYGQVEDGDFGNWQARHCATWYWD